MCSQKTNTHVPLFSPSPLRGLKGPNAFKQTAEESGGKSPMKERKSWLY